MAVKIKKNTIDRESFEREMEQLKLFVKENNDPNSVISEINSVIRRLIDYIDERDADPFAVPEWLTTRVKPEEIGDYVGW